MSGSLEVEEIIERIRDRIRSRQVDSGSFDGGEVVTSSALGPVKVFLKRALTWPVRRVSDARAALRNRLILERAVETLQTALARLDRRVENLVQAHNQLAKRVDDLEAVQSPPPPASGKERD